MPAASWRTMRLAVVSNRNGSSEWTSAAKAAANGLTGGDALVRLTGEQARALEPDLACTSALVPDLDAHFPQQRLYFCPLPQGHGSFRPIFFLEVGCSPPLVGGSLPRSSSR